MVHFICEDCEAFFETARDYQTHRQDTHTDSVRQSLGRH